jgi:hypothetical protein
MVRLVEEALVEKLFVAKKEVVVALVAVAFPMMVRLPLIVEDALAINPLWKRCKREVVAPPKIVRPVPRVPPPIVVDAVIDNPEVVAEIPLDGCVHAS